ncbi:clc channel [Dacryopinax primogenitus]|uniref:Chloride channel protein n=1 Tax=Dacryopinax primogenitus (strain DJM 731) TaxID=1858805 RepID=M5G282_DACPD|nr:clc channel [Dacryopinax primogenitus]EJU02325.1 clc channel [Dacryopinax primogenitus]
MSVLALWVPGMTSYPPAVPLDSALLQAMANGIRVWYASFSSVDWLHDAIKDSMRLLRLRRRHSVRGRVLNNLDRFVGWLIVTLVGALTACVAWLIIRSESWLFDLKEGYCSDGWWKARRFCCPFMDEDRSALVGVAEDDQCPAWLPWMEALGPAWEIGNRWIGLERWSGEYIAYTVMACLLSLLSCLLTIYLTKSTTFVTSKDSGLYSATFDKAGSTPQLDGLPSKHLSRTGEGHLDVMPRKVMYFASGSGIPEIKTILSGFVIHGYLGGRVLFTKSLGLALSVGSGLSLGKEGPFVHIACCVGNIISRFFQKYETNEGRRREILSAASAAGVAVAFGAPIGGVLFSLEEVSYYFPPKVMWRSFFCAMIAAVTLKFLDPFGTGKLVLFKVTYDKDWHYLELPVFALLGVFGGVYGAYFSKLNYRWSKHIRNKTWLKTHPAAEVLLVTLLTAGTCFLNRYTRMGGPELVYNLFAECSSEKGHEGLCVREREEVNAVLSAIGVTLLVKGALTIITFGIKVPAGIFIPTLGVGACFGRIVGLALQTLQAQRPDLPVFGFCKQGEDCIIPGVYAMVGAAATLSGVTRTTVSLAVIMFELTDSLTYTLPVSLAVLVAKTIADRIEPKGIYDLVIDLNNLPYLDAKRQYIWGALMVTDVTNRKVDVIRTVQDNTVKSLRDKLISAVNAGNGDSGFPILAHAEDGEKMIGYIGANELEHALSIVAENPDASCHFHHTTSHDLLNLSISSLYNTPLPQDLYDLSIYMDQAPLTVAAHAPLELVQQLFVKLGAKYVVVVNDDGTYQGVIDRKTWLQFLHRLEEKE